MKRLFFFIFIILLIAAPCWAADWYASSGGANYPTAACTSGDPCSFESCVESRASDGDTCNLAAGTYTQNTEVTLPVGVDIVGAGIASTIIDFGVSAVIRGQTSCCVANSNGNTISDLKLKGDDTEGYGIVMSGRDNVIIRDIHFENITSGAYSNGLCVMGKAGPNDNDSGGGVSFWDDTCGASEPTATHCHNQRSYTVWPGANDWAEGVQIYDNEFTDATMQLGTLKGALIHDNIIDNTSADISGIGNTGYFFHSCEFYNNTINIGDIAHVDGIAIELWYLAGNTKFYQNTANSWFSLGFNSNIASGDTVPYSYQVYNNTFTGDAVSATGCEPAIEIMDVNEDVAVYGNYITGKYCYGVGVWGQGCTIHDILVYNNIIYDIYNTAGEFGTCFKIGAGVNEAASDCSDDDIDDVWIYNNTCHHTDDVNFKYLSYFEGAGDKDGIKIKNNIQINGYVGHKCADINSSGYSNNEWMYNQYYSVANGLNDTWNCSGGHGVTFSNNLTTDPGLKLSGDKPGPYYEVIDSNSNCVDAGVVLDNDRLWGILPGSTWNDSITYVDQDNYGSGWEIGAYVYDDGSVLSPVLLGVGGNIGKN